MTLPSGVRLAVSPLSWTNDVLEDLGGNTPVTTCLNEASEAGYQGIELGRLFPRDPALLKAHLGARHLSLASGWYSGLLAECTVPEECARALEHAAFLRDMRCDVMVYGETGMMAGANPLDAPMSCRLTMDRAAARAYADRLTEFAIWLRSETGIQLAYHHHLMMVCETFDEIAAVLDKAGPQVGLLLDTGHAVAGGFDYQQLLRDFGDRINHIHLKDVRETVLQKVRQGDMSFNDGVRAGMFTVPGDGCIDFKPIAEFVRQSGYRGWLVVEAEQDPATAEPFPCVSAAHDYIHTLFEKV